MTTRAYISLKEKLAAVLCQMLQPDEEGRLAPVIPYDHAKLLTAEQVLSLFQFDHYPIRKAEGGSDKHFNLRPLLIVPHRLRTATVDVPEIAKNKRITREHEEFRRRLLTKEPGKSARPPSRWQSRKLSGRSFGVKP